MNEKMRSISMPALAAALTLFVAGCAGLDSDSFVPPSIAPAGNGRRMDGSVEVQAHVPTGTQGRVVLNENGELEPVNVKRSQVALFESDKLRVALEQVIAQQGLFQRIEPGDADYVLDVWIIDAVRRLKYLGEGYVIDLTAVWKLTRARDGTVVSCYFAGGRGASHAAGTNAYVQVMKAAMQGMIQKGLLKLADRPGLLPAAAAAAVGELPTLPPGSFAAAMAKNSTDACRAYLKRFPAGRHRAEVDAKLEALWFGEANSIPACRQFLAAYPNGRFSSEARTRLDSLCFEQAAGTGTIAAYQQYLAEFPEGRSAAKARWTIEYDAMREAWLKGDTSRLDEFLRSGRSFAESEDAAARLLEILMASIPRGVMLVTDRGPVGTGERVVPNQGPLLAEFRLLLRAGANPDLVRLQGFIPAGPRLLGGTMTLYSTEPSGRIVPAGAGGMTALEFIEINNLTAYKAALLSRGADR